jgi:hypothetical protein
VPLADISLSVRSRVNFPTSCSEYALHQSAQKPSFFVRHEVIIISVPVVLSFVLGLIGYSWMYFGPQAIEGAWSSTDVVYSTLMLYILEAGADTGSISWPWPIHVARFLAPISVGWAAVRSVMVLLGDEMAVFSQGRLKGHNIFIGSSQTATYLARDYLRLGQDVLQSCSDSEDAFKVEPGKGRFFRCQGDSTHESTLYRLRLGHAERVFVATGDDLQNIEVALAIRDFIRRTHGRPQKNGPLPCFLEMSGNCGSPLHQAEAVSTLSKDRILDVRLFQPERVAARRIVANHPPHKSRLPKPGDSALHVLVVGFASLGKEVTKQLIRVCHYTDCQKIQITIVAENAERDWKRFSKEVPARDDIADVKLHPGDPGAITIETWNSLQERGNFDAAYITTSDQSDRYAIAMDARDGLGSGTDPANVVLCGSDATALYPGIKSDEIEIFNLEKVAWTHDYLLHEKADEVAKDIHEAYRTERKNDKKKPFGTKPADKLWNELAEYLRDKNRDQADHIPIKVDILEIPEKTLVQYAEGLPVKPPKMTDDETKAYKTKMLNLFNEFAKEHEIQIETLAKVEHRRWMASTALAGFTLGSPSDEKLRHHEDMKPYANLPDGTQEYDRDAIRKFPRFFSDLKKARESQDPSGEI